MNYRSRFVSLALCGALTLLALLSAPAQGNPATVLPGNTFSYDDGIATFQTEPGIYYRILWNCGLYSPDGVSSQFLWSVLPDTVYGLG